jgi:hypothetical protein
LRWGIRLDPIGGRTAGGRPWNWGIDTQQVKQCLVLLAAGTAEIDVHDIGRRLARDGVADQGRQPVARGE